MESRTDHVRKTRRNAVWIVLVAVLVLVIIFGSLFTLRSVLFASHDTGSGHTASVTTPKPHLTVTPLSVVTQQVPPTQTDCPPANTARAMVTAPLAQGTDPQIVYVPLASNSADTVARIMRYDTVTHNNAEIVNLTPGMIRWASLSSDRQWILIGFVDPAHMSGPTSYVQLEAVRIDGQGLQTLYCGYIGDYAWSPDRHWIAFDSAFQFPGIADTIQLIDTTTGQLLSAVDVPQQDEATAHNPKPATWLSNTQLYLKDLTYVHPSNVYLLDLAKGEHQSISSLQIVTQQVYRALITDGRNLFLNTMTCSDGSTICSSEKTKTALVHLPAQGGTPETIFQDPQLFINNINVINAQNIMVETDNVTVGERQVWVVKSDGSAQKLLASAEAVFASPPFSVTNGKILPYGTTLGDLVVSADGHHFVVTGWPTPDGHSTQICYGSPDGGALTPLDTNGQAVLVLGWIQL